MAVCVQCGMNTCGTGELCSHHLVSHGDDWASGNRTMCDFLHRGIVAPAPRERDEDLELLLTAA